MSITQNDLVNILIVVACISIILYTVPRIKWASIGGYVVVLGYLFFWAASIIFAGKLLISEMTDFPWRAFLIVMFGFAITLVPIYFFVKSSDRIFDKLSLLIKQSRKLIKGRKK